jgi:hypothetical protein
MSALPSRQRYDRPKLRQSDFTYYYEELQLISYLRAGVMENTITPNMTVGAYCMDEVTS